MTFPERQPAFRTEPPKTLHHPPRPIGTAHRDNILGYRPLLQNRLPDDIPSIIRQSSRSSTRRGRIFCIIWLCEIRIIPIRRMVVQLHYKEISQHQTAPNDRTQATQRKKSVFCLPLPLHTRPSPKPRPGQCFRHLWAPTELVRGFSRHPMELITLWLRTAVKQTLGGFAQVLSRPTLNRPHSETQRGRKED